MYQHIAHAYNRLPQTIASATLAALLSLVPVLSASAITDPIASVNGKDDKLKGQVEHVENRSGDASANKDNSFSSLGQPGIGASVNVPTEQKGGVQKTDIDKPTDTKLEEEKGGLDIPAAGKKFDAKAEEAVSQAEYGVDWSAWISTLADRWFMNLKNLEFTAGRTFPTQRPTLIKFTCYRNGMIGGIVLKQTCGSTEYDQMQIKALKRITPLPPFPEGTKRTTYTLCQGWGAHPRKPGEKDFTLGSAGKNFPIEHVKNTHKIK